MYACPNDLMVLDKATMKAHNRDPWMCWECLCCGKICPQQAIDLRGYADFVPLGASAIPLRSTDSILWTIRFRNGTVKRFKFPVRTTEEGSAVPGGKFGPDKAEDINMPYLFTEPASLGVELPVLKR
jgi:adenylylsulfate reductase subunit B